MKKEIQKGCALLLGIALSVSGMVQPLEMIAFAQEESAGQSIVSMEESLSLDGEKENSPIEDDLQEESGATPTPEKVEETLTLTPTPSESLTPMPAPEKSPTPVPVPEESPMPTPTEEPAVLTLAQLKEQIEELLEKSQDMTKLSEEELGQIAEEMEQAATFPVTVYSDEDQEIQELMEQLTNAKAAVENMRMAYQAQREGWLDKMPQTGLENSWRYQNGQRIETEELEEDLPDGVSFFSAEGYRGIDVSHHQGVIDWEAVKNAGIDFAMIRCGYGNDQTDQDDKQWERNVSECERLGIPYGVYFYSYALTADMAVSEGQHAVRLLQGHTPDLPVFFDMEENSQLVVGSNGLAEIARIFTDIVSAQGYEVGVYASLNWWNHYLTDPVFENWYRWVAEWRSSCSYGGRYEMWQYTSDGSVSGINGRVDMDYWYGELNQPADNTIEVEEGNYTIHSALNYLYVLDVANGSTQEGANIQIYESNASEAQQFLIQSAGGGYYTIKNVKSGKVLDVAAGSTAPGTNVQQWGSNHSNAQKWCFQDAGDGYVYIQSKCNGLYLNVQNAAGANGNNVQVYTLNESAAQKFRFTRQQESSAVEKDIYTIRAAVGTNQVLDISGASTADGANVQIYADNGSAAQQFVIYPANDGYYTIQNVGSGKVLDVKDASAHLGANVQQWTENGSSAQQWRFISAGKGYYYIQSRANGLYLDIQGGSPASGTNVQMYTGNKSTAQKFKLQQVVSQGKVENGNYILHAGINYAYVIDISDASKENGGNLQLYTENRSGAQSFRIKSLDNGYYAIENANSGKVLEVDNASMRTGANVQQWTFNGTNAQQWGFVDAGDGFFYIQARCNGMYLTIQSGKERNGANICVERGKTAAQKFKLERTDDSVFVENGTYIIQSAVNQQKVLDISGASKANGGNVQIYMDNGTLAQGFEIQAVGNGYYTIKNLNSQKMLDVDSAAQTNGTNVHQWGSNGTSAQQWRFVDAGDGYYYIQSRCNGLYLDIANGSAANQTNVQVYTGNRSQAQKFKLKSRA
ncbi:RICIN domain-containing protein [Fournierella massiliensis]|nr:RICIN domain-containing protein [Fournierella massiliensis]MCF2557955.1 RICIN domain-containing protein [Fournierella massiliensis]